MLHLPTLFAVTALINLFLGVLLLATRPDAPAAAGEARGGRTLDRAVDKPGDARVAAVERVPSLRAWGAAMLCAALGMGLAAGASGLPYPTVAGAMQSGMGRAADVALLLSAGLMWRAAHAFGAREFRPLYAAITPVLWAACLNIPALGESPALQTVLACLLSFGCTVAAARALPAGLPPPVPAGRMVVILLSLHAGAYLVRGAFALLVSVLGPERSLSPDTISVVFLIEALLFATGLACALLAMAKERAELRSLNSLMAARDAAEAAGEARIRFLGRMSHELRTPLNGMLGMAELVSVDRELPGHLTEHVQMLARAGRHLQLLVGDLLDLARIDAGRIQIAPRPVRLEQLFADCLAIVRPNAEEKRLTLEVERAPGLPEAVLADRTRVQQILLNLLGNAVKFTPEGETIRLRAAVPPDGGVLFEVIDNGPGVPKERQQELFNAWTMISTSDAAEQTGSGAHAGAGLGLAICHGLATAMGGRIGYRPGFGGVGSRFWVVLPLADMRPATQPAPATVTLPAMTPVPRFGRRREAGVPEPAGALRRV